MIMLLITHPSKAEPSTVNNTYHEHITQQWAGLTSLASAKAVMTSSDRVAIQRVLLVTKGRSPQAATPVPRVCVLPSRNTQTITRRMNEPHNWRV